MTDRVLYSHPDDLLVGTNIALPRMLSREAFVRDAAREIDSRLGFRYRTPLRFMRTLPTGERIEVDPSDPSTHTPTFLTIQRLSNNIASGRLLLAIAAPGEDNTLNAYAMKLLRDAEGIFSQIDSGKIALELAPRDEVSETRGSRMRVAGPDPYSRVEGYSNLRRPFAVDAEPLPMDQPGYVRDPYGIRGG